MHFQHHSYRMRTQGNVEFTLSGIVASITKDCVAALSGSVTI